MISWLTQATMNIPPEFEKAERHNERRLGIDRYRSRTDVTNDHIWTAYSWLRLPIISNNVLCPGSDARARYKTFNIPRGVDVEEALRVVRQLLSGIITGFYPFNFVMLNSGTAAAASERVKTWFDESESWRYIDISAMVTSAPNHKVYMYHTNANNTYVVINNIDTPAVVFKIAAAIMLDMKALGDDTETFAQAWLSGNPDMVYATIVNYYAEYKTQEEARKRTEAIEAMCKAMVIDRSDEFERKMRNIQEDINVLLDQLANYNSQLNTIKGEYLVYKLSDEEEKGNELKNFFASCGDKITYLKFLDNELYINYFTKLIFFEGDMLQSYFRSARVNCVNSATPAIQQLLKDIFVEQKYNLLIESGARLNLANNKVYYTEPTNLRSCITTALKGIPNPHHKYYNCWGDNVSNITRAMMEKDYLTAISTVFAAIAGINISDTAVIEKFVRNELYDYPNVPCLENKETGEIITIKQYTERWEDSNASDETD